MRLVTFQPHFIIFNQNIQKKNKKLNLIFIKHDLNMRSLNIKLITRSLILAPSYFMIPVL